MAYKLQKFISHSSVLEVGSPRLGASMARCGPILAFMLLVSSHGRLLLKGINLTHEGPPPNTIISSTGFQHI